MHTVPITTGSTPFLFLRLFRYIKEHGICPCAAENVVLLRKEFCEYRTPIKASVKDDKTTWHRNTQAFQHRKTVVSFLIRTHHAGSQWKQTNALWCWTEPSDSTELVSVFELGLVLVPCVIPSISVKVGATLFLAMRGRISFIIDINTLTESPLHLACQKRREFINRPLATREKLRQRPIGPGLFC